MLDLATFYFLLNISIQFRFGTFNLSEIQISRNNAKTDIYIFILLLGLHHVGHQKKTLS